VPRSADRLREDALQIWRAGLDAVDSRRLVRAAVRVEGDRLHVGNDTFDLSRIRRILVVGAGKAGAGMADAFEQVLGPRLLAEKSVTGWVNVPADCVQPLAAIHLHAARLPGQNEPTLAGAAGADEILRLVDELAPEDLCVALISGGGSALLPAPVAGISLADKLAVTRHLSAAGADIRQLNTVRKQLSRIKGGGLRRACRAGCLVTLVISDVLGDPLDVIASGPTVDDTSTPAEALAILKQFDARAAGITPAVFDYLQAGRGRHEADTGCRATNLVIGNNATAVEAARLEAVRLGYLPNVLATDSHEGLAEPVGRRLAAMIPALCAGSGADCVISGGEPVVQLVNAATRGLGGRNQQLVLAAADLLSTSQSAKVEAKSNRLSDGFALLSGGTDGEDGPTDAAGAIIDAQTLAAAKEKHLDAADFLHRDDAYHFFEPLGALIKTGPTHTNVCDLRVIVVRKK